MTDIGIVDSGDNLHPDDYDMGTYYYGSATMPNLDSFQLYVEYSDDTKELLAKDDEDVTVTYYYNYSNPIAALPETYDLGHYTVSYSYQTQTTAVEFTIGTSPDFTPYDISLADNSLAYPAEPDVTVTENGNVITEDCNLYYITQSDLTAIRNAADFSEQLSDKSRSYNYSYDVKPGSYYVFAYVGENGVRYNSKFKLIQINKGNLSYTPSEELTANYNYNGKTGDVKLSEIDLPFGVRGCKNSKGGEVEGTWQWNEPNREVNSSRTVTASLKFIPTQSDCYNEFVLTNAVTVTINKCRVYVPAFVSYETAYDGQSHDVKVNNRYGYGDDFEDFNNVISVSSEYGAKPADENGLIATRTEIGEYDFTFALKDDINYYWNNAQDYQDTTDAQPKTLTFTVKGKESWINLFGFGGRGWTYAIDENRQVKIKINPGTDMEEDIASPYEAGTLQVEVWDTYTIEWNNEVVNSVVDVTATVENDGEFDYIVITVTDFKNLSDGSGGNIILKITATGKDYYEDIDSVCVDLRITKYTPVCPISKDGTVQATAGTTVQELYNQYPTLETNIGTWVLSVYQGDEWIEITDMDTPLPEGTLECKLEFKADNNAFVWTSQIYTLVYFTLEGTQQTN